MTSDLTPFAPKPGAALQQLSRKQQRLEREKAALKANMTRRKAQARAKSGLGDTVDNPQNEQEE
jgi:hypothetical protein